MECVLCDGSGRLVIPDGGDCIAYEPCPVCEAAESERSEMEETIDTARRRQNMITLSLPLEQGQALKVEMQKHAKKNGRSMSNQIFVILRDYLEANGVTL